MSDVQSTHPISRRCRALLLSTAISAGLLVQPALAQQPGTFEVSAPLATPDQLNQAVAPIALYPDALLAQILAAASFPSEVAAADLWMQQHPGLAPAQLAAAVNQLPWDPSVKALTQFPSVLANMDKNLAWAAALGIDYVQQPQAVLAAVQTMRQRAQQSGALAACTQERAVVQNNAIVIQPVNPAVVYVPQYNPWLVYGPPVPAYPGWVAVPGFYVDGPGILFGAGVGIAAFAAFGWGWHHWGANWGGRSIYFNHRPYFAHGPGFAGRVGGRPGFAGHPGFVGRGGGFAHAGAFHGGGFHGGGFHGGGFGGGGFHGGGFGGFHGGGGGFHGGGGGFHGGGGGGGHGGRH